MIEHVVTAYKESQNEKAFQFYVSDVLRLTLMGVAALGRSNVDIPRYADILDPPKEETRTGKEIIEQMKNKINGINKSA